MTSIPTIAVLLTCHNRREKTLQCLQSLFNADFPKNKHLVVYLVDDGSSDRTAESVQERYPKVNVITGNGDLYWAGGMRLAWKTAMKEKKHEAYLLINDDVVLKKEFITNLLETEAYSLKQVGCKGIYSGATADSYTGKITYGGNRITANHFILKTEKLQPAKLPLRCDMTNANILWVSNEVVTKIGIFDERYTHGIADYDYSLKALKHNIPVWLASGVNGYCDNDHGVNWKSPKSTLKSRIAYLKSPKGLAYDEYLYYIKKHFPLYLPYSFVMIWIKTFFPGIWEKHK